MAKPMPTRKLRKRLRRAGWTHKRTRGTHEVWESPSGRVATLTTRKMADPGQVRELLWLLGGDTETESWSPGCWYKAIPA